MTQLTLFMDFIEKSANRECPGGLYGCGVNGNTDMRCRVGAKYFINKNAFLTDHAHSRTLSPIIFLSVFLSLIIQSKI